MPRTVCETAGFIGLALIGYSVFAFSNRTPFPSVYALAPTIGTALIILFSDQNTLVGRLLGHKLLVGIGLISYSAYLWHQPLFAFATHALLYPPSSALFMVLSLLAIVLAYFSWKYVEIPFRDRNRLNRSQIFRISAGRATDGFASRLSPEKVAFLKYFDIGSPAQAYIRRAEKDQKYNSECDFYNFEAYRMGNPNDAPRASISPRCYRRDASYARSVFLWGDSHAQQLYYGLATNLPKTWQILQVASSGCKASLDVRSVRKPYCAHSNEFAVNAMRDAKPDVVIIGQDSDHDPVNMHYLATYLRTIGVKRVIFTGPTPHWTANLPVIVVWRLWNDPGRYTFTGVDRDVLQKDQSLKAEFQRTPYSQYVSIIDYFCSVRGCLTYIGKDRKLGLTSRDYGHLTPMASSAFTKDVLIPLMLHPSNVVRSGMPNPARQKAP